MKDAVAVGAKPLGFGVGDDGLRDLWVMAALVPAFVAGVAEDDDVAWWAVAT